MKFRDILENSDVDSAFSDVSRVFKSIKGGSYAKGTKGGVVFYFSGSDWADDFADTVYDMLDKNQMISGFDVNHTDGDTHVTVLIQ